MRSLGFTTLLPGGIQMPMPVLGRCQEQIQTEAVLHPAKMQAPNPSVPGTAPGKDGDPKDMMGTPGIPWNKQERGLSKPREGQRGQ